MPEVGQGEVLVKVLSVGICAGDAKCYAGAPYFWGEMFCRLVVGLFGFLFFAEIILIMKSCYFLVSFQVARG